jgi:putative ATP-binding cassette transporter
MNIFLFLFRVNLRTILLAVLVSIVSGVTSAGLIMMTDHIWKTGALTETLWIWRFAGVLAVMVASGVVAQLMVLHLAMRAIQDLRFGLSTKIVSTPLVKLESLGLAKLLPVLVDDVQAVSRVLPNVPRVVIDGTTLVAGVGYMAWLSWKALLVLMVLVVVGVAAYRIVTKRAMAWMRKGRDVLDDLMEHFRALHDGIKQLKINWRRRRLFLTNDIHEALDSQRVTNTRGRTLFIAAENLTRLLFFVLLGIVIFAVPRLGVEPGVLSGYVLMALFLYRPLQSILMMVPDFSRAMVSLDKIESLGLMLATDQLELDETAPVRPAAWKRLELRGVTYTYHREDDDSEFTCGPIDLVLEPGELVFVLGGNGSGKTTLAKLVTSLYPPDSGEILLDGQVIDDSNRESYRQLFSIVFTDYHLFRKLLSEDEEGLDERAAEHLSQLQLDHKVGVTEGRLSTTALSQGQRKRLALLTAYLEDRPFYVLDEWAADQDPVFKKTFYTEVLPELRSRGRTVVVITHDDRYTYVADRCLKLEDGKMTSDVVQESTQ